MNAMLSRLSDWSPVVRSKLTLYLAECGIDPVRGGDTLTGISSAGFSVTTKLKPRPRAADRTDVGVIDQAGVLAHEAQYCVSHSGSMDPAEFGVSAGEANDVSLLQAANNDRVSDRNADMISHGQASTRDFPLPSFFHTALLTREGCATSGINMPKSGFVPALVRASSV